MTTVILIETQRHHAELAIPADDPANIRTTRHTCREILERWGLDLNHPAVDSAIVILSELLTNVHLHAHPLSTFADITLRLDEDRVIVEAHDRHPGRPRIRRSPEPDDQGGRGLFLVRGLALAAGGILAVIMDPDGLGKTVRVELPVRGPSSPAGLDPGI